MLAMFSGSSHQLGLKSTHSDNGDVFNYNHLGGFESLRFLEGKIRVENYLMLVCID